MKIVTNADSSCGECSHGVDPLFRCQAPKKDAPKIGDGRQITLLCSRGELGLSIEMNAKTKNFSGDLIEFRGVSFHINDISSCVVICNASLMVPFVEKLVLLWRIGSGKSKLQLVINT